MNLKTRRFPFYIGISTLVVSIVVTLSGMFLWISHRESKTAAIQMADRLFSEINEKTLERYESTLEAVAVLAGSAARMPGMATRPAEDSRPHPGMELMLEALGFYEFIFSTYIGYDDGSFIQIVGVRDRPELRLLFDAPAETAYVLRTISAGDDGLLKQRWRFLNRERQDIGERMNLDPDYDPRTRPWYIRAKQEETAFFHRSICLQCHEDPRHHLRRAAAGRRRGFRGRHHPGPLFGLTAATEGVGQWHAFSFRQYRPHYRPP